MQFKINFHTSVAFTKIQSLNINWKYVNIMQCQILRQLLFLGLNTWNINDNHVDIESELKVITDCAPPGEEARGGKKYLETK